MTTGLHVDTSHQAQTWIVALEGEFDVSVAEPARAQIDRVLRQAPAAVILDLRALEFMDSSGVHLLIDTSRRCELAGVRFVVLDGPPQVHRLLTMCGLDDYFELRPAPGGAPGDLIALARGPGAARPGDPIALG